VNNLNICMDTNPLLFTDLRYCKNVLLVVATSVSLRSSLFRFLSGKRESREGSGTEVTKKLVAGGRAGKGLPPHPLPPVPRFALAPCVRATYPWLSLSPAKRQRKRLLRRLTSVYLWGEVSSKISVRVYVFLYTSNKKNCSVESLKQT